MERFQPKRREAGMDTSGVTGLDALASRLDDLQAQCGRVIEENAVLRDRLSHLDPGGPDAAATPSRPDRGRDTKSGADGRISRRGVLGKALGAAAVTAVGGAVLMDRNARPASAANGNAVAAGNLTNAETSTQVKYDGSGGFGGVVLLGNDSTYSGDAAGYPAGVGGWAGAGASAGSGGVANGVYGFTDNGSGNGVVGVNTNAQQGPGAGVLGIASGYATAVQGTNDRTLDNATAVSGVMSSTSPGNQSSAVLGQNNGTGGSGIGVWGSQAGSGLGMYATSASGIGLKASGGSGTGVSTHGKTGLAASGTTTGMSASGPTAISASGSGATGVALAATAASSHPAVQATNTGSGAALQVNGPSTFSRSGTAVVAGTLASPQSSVTVTGVTLSAASLFLATAQVHVAGVNVAGVVTNVPGGSFTIFLSKAVKANTPIAWFVLS
jgi:hypothetical protein